MKILDLLPNRKEICLVVRGAFSSQACDDFLQDKTFRKAHTHYPTSYRNNDRLVVDSEALAAQLFEVVSEFIPKKIQVRAVCEEENGDWQLVGLNSRIRFCRYLPQQYFNKHLDGVHYMSPTRQSKLTFMLYLTDHSEFEGGRTLFFDSKESDQIIQEFLPHKGDLIIFDHNLWHSGEQLESGEKYILRSDLIYERTESRKTNSDAAFSEGHLGYIWQIISFGQGLTISGGRDKTIKCWDADGGLFQVLEGHKNSVVALLELNEKTLVSASRDQTIKIWKWENGSFQLRQNLQAHQATILALCRLDRRCFLSSGGDGMIFKFDEYGQLLASWKAHNEWVWAMAKLNDLLFSCGEDGLLKGWQQSTNKLVTETRVANAPLTCITTSQDKILVGDYNGNITILKLTENQYLKDFQQFSAHRGIIRTLALDWPILASGGEDNCLHVWNLETGEKLKTFEHQNFVQSAFWRGGRLLSAAYDGRIRVWNAN